MSTSLAAPPGLGRDTWRWIAGLLVVLALHAATMLWLIARVPMEIPATAPALTIDMEPEPAPAPPAAEPEPTPAAAEPQAPPPVAEPEPAPPEPQPAVEPPPPEPEPVANEAIPEQELPAVPQAEVALPPPPKVIERRRPPQPPKPPPARVRPKQAPPAESPASAQPAAAAQPAPAAPSPAATASWQGQILAHLNRFKRYPAEAQMRRHQGVAYLRFTLNRAGRVLRFALDRGSGHELLDREALALIERAQPLPAPPAELTRETFELIVPLQFHLR